MKYLIFLFWLVSVSVRGATGDVTASIDASGWTASFTIVGLNTNGTYTLGYAANNTISSTTPYFTVTSMGFDSSGAAITTTRTVYLTKQLRKAYPLAAEINEVYSAPNLTVRVALSQRIYQKESTNLTFTASSGWYAQGGTNCNSSSALSVTNNSTAAYPLPLGQWDEIAGVGNYDRVKSDFVVAFNGDPVETACVRFDATGQTSGATVNSTVSTLTQARRSATGLFMNNYSATFVLSGFTQGEKIDLRARLYPAIGDTILDTDNNTGVNEEVRGWRKAIILCDKNNSLDSIKYVAASGGSDSNPGTTGSPYATIGKGIANGNIVYLKAGTHSAVGATPASNVTGSEWRIVQPEPGQDSTTVTVQLTTTRAYNCERLQYYGIKITRASTGSWLDGQDQDNALQFVNCVFDSTGAGGTPTVGPGYRSKFTSFKNCTGDLGHSNWHLTDFSSARIGYRFDGCTLTEANASSVEIGPYFRVVSCSGSGSIAFVEHSTSNVSPTQENLFFCNNKFTGFNQTAHPLLRMGYGVAITRGICVSGNTMEETDGNQALVYMGADSSTVVCNHVIFRNNTLAGNRWNCGYNDTGSTPYDRLDWSVTGNLIESWATKHDTFTGGSGANGLRIGGWPVLYGVGFYGNMSAHIGYIGASGSFMFEWIGSNSYQPSPISGQPPQGATNVTSYLKFFNRQAYTGSAGSGSGNYRINASSPATAFIAGVLSGPDLTGQTRGKRVPTGAYTFTHPGLGFFGQ